MSWLSGLARPSILRLEAYKSARSIATEAQVFLDANEAPNESPNLLNRYPNPQPPELVQRFAELYGVNAENILVGRGSDEAIDILTRTFCEPAQDAILITPPTYGMYRVSADIQNADTLAIPLIFNGEDWELSTQEMIARIRDPHSHIMMTYICSPNNPTGTVFAQNEIRKLCEASTKSLVVVDEAYVEFAPETSAIPLLKEFKNLVILRTLSKAWALAGLRCGVAIGDPELIALLQKVRAPYPLPRPVIEAVLTNIDPQGEKKMLARVEAIKSEREKMRRALNELKIVDFIFESSTNFLLVRFTDEAKVMKAVRGVGIILRSRTLEIKNTIRITIGTEQENEILLKALYEVAP
jgi:histidinol-phosphate aminotransferase